MQYLKPLVFLLNVTLNGCCLQNDSFSCCMHSVVLSPSVWMCVGGGSVEFAGRNASCRAVKESLISKVEQRQQNIKCLEAAVQWGALQSQGKHWLRWNAEVRHSRDFLSLAYQVVIICGFKQHKLCDGFVLGRAVCSGLRAEI